MYINKQKSKSVGNGTSIVELLRATSRYLNSEPNLTIEYTLHVIRLVY